MSSSGTANDGNSHSGSGSIRKSIIGSFKRFSRKASYEGEPTASRPSGGSGSSYNHGATSSTAAPAAASVVPRSPVTGPRPADQNDGFLAAPSAETARELANRRDSQSRSPLVNPSPATRRPAGVNDPPPPYEAVNTVSPTTASASAGGRHRPASLAPSTRSNISRLTVNDITTAEDRYAFLSTFDTIFVIDDSGSMAGRSWQEVGAVLANIAPICTTHDADGIDLYFLNHKTPTTAATPPGKATGGYSNVRDVATVNRIFETVRPGGSTPTGTRISNIIRPYLRYYQQKLQENPDEPELKPVNMIVITDGEPSDDLEGVLYHAAQKLDSLDAPPFQVGIQFFKVGNEPGASEYLRTLDDHLSELVRGQGVRDMVDTVTWDAYIQYTGAGHAALTADGILKAVLGAVVKRLDRLPTGPARPPSAGR
ncbi:von willebrand factor [Grosmannia clavigera kw1407]|uniref:von willebrand factor n=1 Tax=Grosmannia clavigera (strain kw1407 / UAMH 11150) TaxID=655863 RepID=F0XA66_GROCL|nr:von willebrand factor [Grosmannia clavigera kw1407]EFX05263.1 von willebrand factor [Grosmannia clavigera kw1407]